ncbi:type II toxin-antitoxin system Phd/YefM family antitoxin [Zophobihabitans entericus]|uniref:Antitoxin n=1 Tax=Zophobihabitans entericus TaxID=1635327 RepID=A0A6G9IFP6_9GAMM|nr:type II toxin-antitoxin system Phd/YefM family antitoxin [Zophobihabitans entericus]
METMTAFNAKTHFGEAIIKAQSTPIQVTKNGKPVMVMISAEQYDSIEKLKAAYEAQQIKLGQEDIKAGRYSEGTAIFDKILSK